MVKAVCSYRHGKVEESRKRIYVSPENGFEFHLFCALDPTKILRNEGSDVTLKGLAISGDKIVPVEVIAYEFMPTEKQEVIGVLERALIESGREGSWLSHIFLPRGIGDIGHGTDTKIKLLPPYDRDYW